MAVGFNLPNGAFRQTAEEAGGQPDYMRALTRGLEASQASAKTLNTPRQLSEDYLKSVLKNQHDKTINKYLDRSELARIGGMELRNTGQSLANKYAPQNQSDKVRAALDAHFEAQTKNKMDRFKAEHPFLYMTSPTSQLLGNIDWLSDPANKEKVARMNADAGQKLNEGKLLPNDEQSAPPQVLSDKLKNGEGREMNVDRFSMTPGQPMTFEMEGGHRPEAGQAQELNPEQATANAGQPMSFEMQGGQRPEQQAQPPMEINMEGGQRPGEAKSANPLLTNLQGLLAAGLKPKQGQLSTLGKHMSEQAAAVQEGRVGDVEKYNKMIDKDIAQAGGNKMDPYKKLELDVKKAGDVAQAKANVLTKTGLENNLPAAESLLKKIDNALEVMPKHKEWFGAGALGLDILGGPAQAKRGAKSGDYGTIEGALINLVGAQALKLQAGNRVTQTALNMAEKAKPGFGENYEIAYRKLNEIRDELAQSISQGNTKYRQVGGKQDLTSYKGFEPQTEFASESDYHKYMQSLSPHKRNRVIMSIKLKGEK